MSTGKKLTVFVEGGSKLQLGDRDYIGAGGQAVVYRHGDIAYKIYHDQKDVIPLKKIRELQAIAIANVLAPQKLLYDQANSVIGYTMRFVRDTNPVCRLFTKTFKLQNNISEKDVVEFVKAMQVTVKQIHGFRCLIVDLNELNVLAADNFKEPFFIDTDSYQTPSFRATAIMESIRDPLVKGNNFTQESDWFSFAVIAFQLYIGIHPYKGRHPDYKVSDWQKRMKDGVSVFDNKVSLPNVCADFGVIPQRHLEWFKMVFVKNQRCEPPMPDGMVPVTGAQVYKTIVSNQQFDVRLLEECPEEIAYYHDIMGVSYFVGTSKIWMRKKALADIGPSKKTLLCETTDQKPVIAQLKQSGRLEFSDMDGKVVGTIAAQDMMYRNGCIYSLYGDQLTENGFVKMNDRIFHTTRLCCQVSALTARLLDGLGVQDLLGKWHLILPCEAKSCIVKYLPELDGYRIMEGMYRANIVVILAEKKGVYDKFIIEFEKNYSNYFVRKDEDVGYCEISFAVKSNGVVVMTKDGEVEIFKGLKVKSVQNPPFDASNALYNVQDSIRFTNGNKLLQAEMK